MTELRIDRLTLSLEGISPEDGRRLGELLAERLAELELRKGRPARARLSVRLDAAPGTALDVLARRAAAALASELDAGGSRR